MKRTNSLAVFSGWLALALTGAAGGAEAGRILNATARESGSISGRVQNVVTGQYLNNARVSVKGTELVAFTDQYGAYRLVNVPAGAIVLEVFYTGLDPRQLSLKVSGGETLTQDVSLSSVARYGTDTDVVRLDPFVISSSKETNGQAIATQEQRFAPNVKNVVAVETFGDVTEGNMGEFMKLLPGISAERNAGEISAISVRGLGSDLTKVTSDGNQMPSANVNNSSRIFLFSPVSINNVSRVEVTKVPTPATPADTLGGDINMITKSAFERSGARLTYRVYALINSENITLHKTADVFEKYTYKVLPGFDFDYTLPVTKDFGLVVTGLSTRIVNEQHLSTTTYTAGGTATNASIARPYLSQYALQDGPKITERNSASLRADWRVTPNSVLSLVAQASHWWSYYGTETWTASAGTTGTPTPATGTALSFGDDYVIGATGRGAITMGGGFTDSVSTAVGGNIRYRFDDGRWRLDAGVHRSTAKRTFRAPSYGHFSQLTTVMMVPVRVTFRDINATRPGTIEVFDNNNQRVDISRIENHRLTGATATVRDMRDDLEGGDVNLRRQFEIFSLPTAIQIGGRQRIQEKDTRLQTINWTYNGPDGNAAVAKSAAPYLSKVYAYSDAHYGFHDIPWTSPHLAWDDFQKNPILFSKTPAQIVTEETFRITNSEQIRETVSALYLQTEVRLLKNRLNMVTGVRYEKTKDDGRGPLVDLGAAFLRTAGGSFARNAQGARVRRPEAGAAGSLEELRLTRIERGYHATQGYDGYYPSLHFTYNVTDHLLARLAYARTYGRPDFTQIIPNATVSEKDLDESSYNDPTTVRGTINVRNTALKPWTANNYDLSLEYYTDRGGLVTAGVFVKDISDFFGDAVTIATLDQLETLGVDSRYVGWQLSTRYNGGDARVAGVELNVTQSLGQLGGWGRYFSVFANGTKLQLRGDRDADFSSFIKNSMNWGFTFSRKPFTFMAKWNYRGQKKSDALPSFGPDAYNYTAATTQLDLNLECQVGRRLALFANGMNVWNAPETLLRYGSQTPAYARQFRTTENGAKFTVGIKGSF